MYAIIIDENENILVEHIDIESDSDFDAVEKQAKEYDYPVCIEWHRPSDGQVAYWSPRGASFKPHWYNKRGGAMPRSGAPEKPLWLKKKQIGLQLPQWIIDSLDGLEGSRAVEIESALIEKFGWEPPN